ncbi:ABC transporter substrate-binding protein, partial [Nocardia salmonicida]
MSVRTVLGRGAVRLLCTVAGGALLLTGCAENTEGDGASVNKVSAEKVDALAAAVPDKVKQAGK